MTKIVPGPEIDIRRIMELLPHRYPFLMIDQVREFVPESHITCIKNVTVNEPHFQGHFPHLPVMPGVLQLEALAQAAGIFIMTSYPEDYKGKIFVFSGMDKVRFRRPVVPGDQLVLTCDNFRRRMHIFKMHCLATVDGKTCVEAELGGALVDEGDL